MPPDDLPDLSSDTWLLAIGSAFLAVPGLAGPFFGIALTLDGGMILSGGIAIVLTSGIGFALLVGYWRGILGRAVPRGRRFWIVSAVYNLVLLVGTVALWATAASEFGPHQVWFALFAAWLLFAITVSVRRVRSADTPPRSS